MNNFPRQTLRRIVDKYGTEICGDARRCEALLNDLCGSYRREVNVLVNAIEERIPLDLLAGARSMSPRLLLTRLEKRLEDQQGLTADAARWAVESWALALGVVTEAEIEGRRREQSNAPPARNAETVRPPRIENKTTNQNSSGASRANPAPPRPSAPSQTPKNAPPATRQPSNFPQSAPPARVPATTQPTIQAPTGNQQPAQSNPGASTKSRFGIFRGCLIIVFLLAIASVVLMLGVPYAIEVMRETQRERESEPPRFPAR